MSELKNNTLSAPTEDDDIEVVSRRHLERRGTTRRTCSKPRMLCPDSILNLRKQDNNAHFIYRDGERRQQKRRKSRPSLIKLGEIVFLRKK
jgi:hypothetical protein